MTCPVSSSRSIPDPPICSGLIVRVTVAATVVFLHLGRSGRADSVDVSCVCFCEELTCPQAHAIGRPRCRSASIARVLQSCFSRIGRPCVAVRLGPASPHQFNLSCWKRLADSGSVWLFYPTVLSECLADCLPRLVADLCLRSCFICLDLFLSPFIN